jgi:hypothetical protein
MSRTIEIPAESVVPGRADLVRAMGGTEEQAAGENTRRVLDEAVVEFRRLAEPRGIVAETDAAKFAAVYEGEGKNGHPSPLLEIFPAADALFLFVVTVGVPVGERIGALLDSGEYALAASLDAAASVGVELGGDCLDALLLKEAREAGRADAETRVLRYSPGYCGWDITGQRALFARLKPDTIGVTLTESCLMEPLKSISGVAVMGPANIHMFEDDYSFCTDCRTRDCRRRIAELR